MEQSQQLIQTVGSHRLRGRTHLFIAQTWLGNFNVETAEFIPGKVVQDSRIFGVLILCNSVGDLPCDGRQSTEQPTILQRKRREVDWLRLVAVHVHQNKASRVPEFVDEVACGFKSLTDNRAPGLSLIFIAFGPLSRKDAFATGAFNDRETPVFLRLVNMFFAMGTFKLNRHANILRFGCHACQTETQRIGTELVDDVDRIDTIALALAHALPKTILNFGVNVDFAERNLAKVIPAHQNHPRNPQRDNVA